MPPRVRLGRTHGRSNTPRHEIQAGADLNPRQPALRRSHKFTALTEFRKRLRVLENLTRPNSLFVSGALQNNQDTITKLSRVFELLDYQVERYSDYTSIEGFFRDDKVGSRIRKFLDNVNTGIKSYKIVTNDFIKAIPPIRFAVFRDDVPATKELIETKLHTVNLSSQSVHLEHKDVGGKPVILDFSEESDGTQWLIVQLGPIFRALDEGRAIAIDEFGATVHTLATEAILRLFASKETNPKGAQLIVATHDTNLLG
jgi:AAA domain, putative AbiEii toxin, Type IV TA system